MKVKHSCSNCKHRRDVSAPCEWLGKQKHIILNCPHYEEEEQNTQKLKPYMKVLTPNRFEVCAIYEPHPFRPSVIAEAVEQSGRTPTGLPDVADDAWCWVYYDWCGNPVGLSSEKPVGLVVDTFTEENIGSKSLEDYLNHENAEAVEAWYRRNGNVR